MKEILTVYHKRNSFLLLTSIFQSGLCCNFVKICRLSTATTFHRNNGYFMQLLPWQRKTSSKLPSYGREKIISEKNNNPRKEVKIERQKCTAMTF